MKRLKSGSQDLRNATNPELNVETLTANGAVSVLKGITRLNGSSLAMTLVTPPAGSEGFEKRIVNISGSAATVTATGMDVSGLADVFTLAAASATSRPTLHLMVINVAAAGAAPDLKWMSMPLGTGVTVA